MRYRLLKPKGKDKTFHQLATQRTGGKCEAALCRNTEQADVCKMDDGTIVVLCGRCRYVALGLSPGEKSTRRKQFKAAQGALFSDD